MSALPTSQETFLVHWETVYNTSTPQTHPGLFRKIFKIRDVLSGFSSKLDTLDASKQALDYLTKRCINQYGYIFLSDIIHDFELTMGRAIGFEPEVEAVHRQIFDVIDKIKVEYGAVARVTRDVNVRFYGRCIDHRFGPQERDRLLRWIEKPPGLHPRPEHRWCQYSFGGEDHPFINRLLNLGDRKTTRHEILYLQDHMQGFRQRLQKAVSDIDLDYLMNILNSQYSRYFHVFAVDILASFVVNVCQNTEIDKLEEIIKICLEYSDSATEKVRVFYQLSPFGNCR